MRRSPEGDRKALWKLGLNQLVLCDKYAIQQKDFALRSDKGALRSPP